MKLVCGLLAVAVLGLLAGVAYVSQLAEPAAAKMVRAAEKLVASLTAEQKAKASYDFDDRERTNWYFTPQQKGRKPTRKGLPLEEMTAEQQETTRDLLSAGTSGYGDKQALTIMSLELVLRDLEKNGAMVRNPGWYFLTVFGKPDPKGKWGWRIEGHHLSLNFTFEDGKLVSSTPAFFGANPATVKNGDRKGLRTIPEAEDLSRELFQALDEGQKKVAHQEKQFPEIAEHTTAPKAGEPRGLAAEKMTEPQQDLLWKLLQSYTGRMPAEVAEVQLSRVKKAGLGKVHFAWAGSVEPGKPHTYRIQGPTFVVEFLNVQTDGAGNPANHIHSVWRNMEGDFGLETR